MARDELLAGRLDGYDPEVGAALWRLEDARSRTLRLLEGVSPTMLDTAVPGNSIGTVLYHVALIEANLLVDAREGESRV